MLLGILAGCFDVPGNEYYASPTGKPDAAGTQTDPWDLRSALAESKGVAPGDTIWLRGGLYRGTYESNLTGAPNKPIIVRAAPGERVTIDTGTASEGAGLFVRGSDCWYWGIEIMSSNPKRSSSQKGSDPTDIQRVPGVVVHGPRTKFINLVVHDTAGGYGYWSPAKDSEVYGSLIYYNGWSAPDRGHGHAIYAQNELGKKRIEDCIAFSNFGMGIRAYGTEQAFANNIEFIGNIAFNSGVLYVSPPHYWANFFATVGKGAQDILFESNFAYLPSSDTGGSSLGWAFSDREKNVIARNNYWVGGNPALGIWNWDDVTFEGNVAYSEDDLVLLLNHAAGQDRSKYQWDHNKYYGSDLMRLNGKNLRWSQWRQTTGLDLHSEQHEGRPSGCWVFVRPNRYEPGRANVVIYNWDGRDHVEVDLNGVLSKGQRFEIRDAQNFYQELPTVSGRFDGSKVRIPMTGLTPATPVGVQAPRHTAPEFGAFIVLNTAEPAISDQK